MDEARPDAGREALVAPPGVPDGDVEPAVEGGFDVGLLVLLLVVLGYVCISNVWLRHRAERENDATDDESTAS
jgi:hypothetical protein